MNDDHAQRAREIVSRLPVPDDPNRWGQSPVTVSELEEMIVHALTDAVVAEREACALVAELTEPFDTVANVSPIQPLERWMVHRMQERIADAIRARGGTP